MSASPGPVAPPTPRGEGDPEGERGGPGGEGTRRPAEPTGGSAAPTGPARGGGFSGVGALFSELVSDRPGTAALAALLLLAGNITEGFSLLALIPLLYASGFGDGETGGAVSGALVSSLEAIGVSLTLPAALGLFVGLVGVRAAATWQRDAVFARAQLGAVDRLRERLHRAMAAAPWRFLASRSEADLRHVLTGEVRRVGGAFGHLLHVTVALTVAATHLAVAFVISPPTAGAILVAIGALYCLTRPLLRRSETLGGEITDANRVIYAQVQDFLAGLKFAKSHAAERAHVAHLSAAVTALRERRLASATVAALARAAIQFGAAVVLAAAGWFVLVETGLPLPTLVVVVVLSARTMTMLGGVQWRAHDLANTLPAFLHARSALADLTAAAEEHPEEPPSAPSSRTVRSGGPPPPGGRRGEAGRMVLSERLGVRGVSFDYLRDFGAAADREPTRAGDPAPGRRGREEPGLRGPPGRGAPPEGEGGGAGGGALREIDLDLRRGEFLVLSGPSGAGKTTLADLLVGLMPPTTGRISVDGVALDGGNRRRWRASCALLAARPYLFPGRIRANLAWGREDADEGEMRRALEAAAADFVFRLPEGVDAEIGDGGAGLSAGERQRLAFARALLRRPTLLVLDEATSQLDEANEGRVLETLRSLRGETTVVATTHSAAFLAAADRVVRIESGRLLAPGASGGRPAAPLRARPGAPSLRPG